MAKILSNRPFIDQAGRYYWILILSSILFTGGSTPQFDEIFAILHRMLFKEEGI